MEQTPTNLSDASFEAEVLQSSRPVLVDFWAGWCGPCHVLAPTIEDLAGEYADSVTAGKLDLDASPESARRFGIQSISSVLLFDSGKVVGSFVGVQPKEVYAEALDQLRRAS